MRNRRLLTLAVLAVALGCAAFAQAETAVVTLLDDGANTFAVRLTLAGGTTVGSDSLTPGFADFAIKAIAGTSSAAETPMTVEAPGGTITDTGTTTQTDAGFQFLSSGGTGAGVTPYSAAGAQNFAYGTQTEQQLYNAAVLSGVGTTGSTDNGGVAAITNGTGAFVWDVPNYDADTKILSGTYTGSTAGNLDITTWGPVSFSVLPTDNTPDATHFAGPSEEPYNTDGSAYVDAVVIQQVQGVNGNKGGRDATSADPTTLRVEYGSVTLGANFASGTYLTLKLSDPNVSIALGKDMSVGGVDLQSTTAAGGQSLDVGVQKLDVYDASTAQLDALVAAEDATGLDGLYSSALDGTNGVLVVTPEGGDHIAVVATLSGDATLDRTVNNDDYFALSGNWFQSGKNWTEGDFTGDGTVNNDDYFALSGNWFQTFTPAAGAAVPEPATLSLIGFGLLGVLRRRRK